MRNLAGFLESIRGPGFSAALPYKLYMRDLIFLFLLVSFAFSLACTRQPADTNTTAATATPGPPVTKVIEPDPDANVPRITVEDAKKEFDKGGAVFVDARPAGAYEVEHIKGAINITSETLDRNINSLPKNKKIIVYCS